MKRIDGKRFVRISKPKHKLKVLFFYFDKIGVLAGKLFTKKDMLFNFPQEKTGIRWVTHQVRWVTQEDVVVTHKETRLTHEDLKLTDDDDGAIKEINWVTD